MDKVADDPYFNYGGGAASKKPLLNQGKSPNSS